MFAFFETIPIKWRFFGIGFLFTLIFLGHIVFDLSRQLIHEKETLQTRIEGLNYIEETNTLIAVFQKIRGLSNIYLEGDQSVLSDITLNESKAKEIFSHLSDMKHPTEGDTCNEKLDDIRHRFEDTVKRFNSLRTGPTTESQEAELFDTYSEMVDHLLYFNSYIAVTYNIGESSDWHLFVLSELLSERIPSSIEILGRLRGIASGSIQHGALTLEDKEQMLFYIKLLKHNRTIIQSKLTHIFEHDPQVKKTMGPLLKAAMASNHRLVSNIEIYLADPESVNVDAKTFFTMATKNLDNAFKLLSSIHDILQQQNHLHSQQKINALWMKILFESFLLLSGLTLFWLFYLSSMGHIKKVENAEKAKAVFLSHMSHEIRTPLNAILGFIDLLKEKTKDAEGLGYIDTIKKSSTLLLNIINDILDLSKIESGKLTIESLPLHPRPEFAPIIAIYSAKALEKEIDFETVFDPAVPECITSDPVRLKQIIGNLLSNAIKFTPEKGKVSVRFGYIESSHTLTCSVEDNGIGIPASKQKQVFDSFSQAEESTTRIYGGTGLGLAICSKLISMLGGRIYLESSEGNGSTFSFEIPLKHCEYCTPAYSSNALEKLNKMAQPQQSDRFQGKVLLVEDNETNQIYMEIILKKLGLEYEIANDGIEAVERFKRGHYDIILMDENMPNMNGLEATHIILQIEKEEKRSHTPIIAITANALQGDKEVFIEAGMDGYLSKPVDKTALAGLLEQFMKKEILINQSIKSFTLNAKP